MAGLNVPDLSARPQVDRGGDDVVRGLNLHAGERIDRRAVGQEGPSRSARADVAAVHDHPARLQSNAVLSLDDEVARLRTRVQRGNDGRRGGR